MIPNSHTDKHTTQQAIHPSTTKTYKREPPDLFEVKRIAKWWREKNKKKK